ncbi:16896_t:CDS:2 [Acaulospora morrowiae]|uniref:Zinc finger protein unc-98 n=1 Tax=Acaulospora morrowiae TaxID=94023 RepID=A0A9N9B2F7_9GLOM|nr:16896_t:CDS:2 [Acaulospora morrowiae]
MQSKNSTSLPPIKFLLDSPIDDGHGPLFGFPAHTPSSPLDAYNRPQSFPPMSTQSTESRHSPVVSKHASLSNLPSPRANNSIRSLLSPPQSPEMITVQQPSFDIYGARQASENYVAPQSVQPPLESQCACCVRPTPVYSSSHPPYSQPTGTMLPNASPIKHFSSHEQMSPNGSSSGNRYQCPYCSKRFSRPSSLRIHTYSHTGEKPFICTEPGCGRKFSVQSNMRRHLRVHRMGRTVKKPRYDGEVEGVKMLSHNATILRGY